MVENNESFASSNEFENEDPELIAEVQALLDSLGQQNIDSVDQASQVLEGVDQKQSYYTQVLELLDQVITKLRSQVDSDHAADIDRHIYRDALNYIEIINDKWSANQYISPEEYKHAIELLQQALASKVDRSAAYQPYDESTDQTVISEQATKNCPHCGAIIASDSNFCDQCGVSQEYQ